MGKEGFKGMFKYQPGSSGRSESPRKSVSPKKRGETGWINVELSRKRANRNPKKLRLPTSRSRGDKDTRTSKWVEEVRVNSGFLKHKDSDNIKAKDVIENPIRTDEEDISDEPRGIVRPAPVAGPSHEQGVGSSRALVNADNQVAAAQVPDSFDRGDRNWVYWRVHSNEITEVLQKQKSQFDGQHLHAAIWSEIFHMSNSSEKNDKNLRTVTVEEVLPLFHFGSRGCRLTINSSVYPTSDTSLPDTARMLKIVASGNFAILLEKTLQKGDILTIFRENCPKFSNLIMLNAKFLGDNPTQIIHYSDKELDSFTLPTALNSHLKLERHNLTHCSIAMKITPVKTSPDPNSLNNPLSSAESDMALPFDPVPPPATCMPSTITKDPCGSSDCPKEACVDHIGNPAKSDQGPLPGDKNESPGSSVIPNAAPNPKSLPPVTTTSTPEPSNLPEKSRIVAFPPEAFEQSVSPEIITGSSEPPAGVTINLAVAPAPVIDKQAPSTTNPELCIGRFSQSHLTQILRDLAAETQSNYIVDQMFATDSNECIQHDEDVNNVISGKEGTSSNSPEKIELQLETQYFGFEDSQNKNEDEFAGQFPNPNCGPARPGHLVQTVNESANFHSNPKGLPIRVHLDDYDGAGSRHIDIFQEIFGRKHGLPAPSANLATFSPRDDFKTSQREASGCVMT